MKKEDTWTRVQRMRRERHPLIKGGRNSAHKENLKVKYLLKNDPDFAARYGKRHYVRDKMDKLKRKYNRGKYSGNNHNKYFPLEGGQGVGESETMNSIYHKFDEE